MPTAIDIIRKPRMMMLNNVKDLSTEQLNYVPKGFNNNIIWNLAHIISAAEGICYARAGLPVNVADKFYSPYRPDTKPQAFVDTADIAAIKELFLSTLDKLEADLEKGIFTTYPTWTTRYGLDLTSIDDAVAFLPFHEGLHCGYMMALKRVVLQEV
ncbi:DinB superfamily protein [Mucilaginibacter pineti]|uniref:DinB superfamily protein n=1 Tax=Mucilaginibacter pineti TaxID=1391627 RepID=A0A1G7CWG5_9SPHI|nr:DinB family protein [Mucilaginibacter pineti]SDE43583.1 DinB superfamily protein [Mucilaginibacter pineti]